MKKHPLEQQAAFILENGDRFHSIAVSDPILFEEDPLAESVITFFFIQRANGTCDAVNVNKIFNRGKPVSRTIETKNGIPGSQIQEQSAATLRLFADGIERETGYRIKWNLLDLSDVEDRHEQVLRIQAWGRIGVRLATDIPPNALN